MSDSGILNNDQEKEPTQKNGSREQNLVESSEKFAT